MILFAKKKQNDTLHNIDRRKDHEKNDSNLDRRRRRNLLHRRAAADNAHDRIQLAAGARAASVEHPTGRVNAAA